MTKNAPSIDNHDVANVAPEITPEMIAAGAEIIDSQFGEITTFDRKLAPSVAKQVFRAMLDLQPKPQQGPEESSTTS